MYVSGGRTSSELTEAQMASAFIDCVCAPRPRLAPFILPEPCLVWRDRRTKLSRPQFHAARLALFCWPAQPSQPPTSTPPKQTTCVETWFNLQRTTHPHPLNNAVSHTRWGLCVWATPCHVDVSRRARNRHNRNKFEALKICCMVWRSENCNRTARTIYASSISYLSKMGGKHA